jgi:hypothetical protein
MATLVQQLEAATRKTIASAGPRYSPALDPTAPNLEIAGLVDAVSALVLGERARARVTEHAVALRKAAKDAEYTLEHLLRGVQITPVVIADELDALAEVKSTVEMRARVIAIRRHLRLASRCVERRQRVVEAKLAADRDALSEQPDDARSREREVLQYRARDLREVWSSLRDVDEWTSGADGQLLVDRQCALLIGAWGTGKTHFACDVALAVATDGVPAVVVLANSLRDDLDPLDAVSAAIGIGTNGAHLASMLDGEAKRVGRRTLIMIDAINEADRPAWRRRLVGLTRTVARYEHLGLVLTCRTPFNRAIVSTPAERRLVTLQHRGFDNQEFDGHCCVEGSGCPQWGQTCDFRVDRRPCKPESVPKWGERGAPAVSRRATSPQCNSALQPYRAHRIAHGGIMVEVIVLHFNDGRRSRSTRGRSEADAAGCSPVIQGHHQDRPEGHRRGNITRHGGH